MKRWYTHTHTQTGILFSHKTNEILPFVTIWTDFQFSWVQFSHSVVSDSAAPWIAARQASLSTTNSRSSLKLMSIKLVKPSNHLILCHPLLLLPSIFPASGSFQMSQFFASGGQSIGVSPSISFQWIFRNGLISLQDFLGGSNGEVSAYNEGDLGSIPE